MTDSVFLPGTKIQIIWDSVSRGWLKRCPRLYQYHMIEGWQGRGYNVHIRFGLMYHAALEAYDKARAKGNDHEAALIAAVWSALVQSWEYPNDPTLPSGPWVSDHKHKNRENLIRSVVWYCEQFKDDPAQTVVLADGTPAVELTFKMELDFGPISSSYKAQNGDERGPRYVLSGHIDRLVTFAGGTYVTDRKTTGSTLGSWYFDQYTPDDQMSGYTLAGKVLWHQPVKGVMIDAAQIAVGFTRFERGFAYRTDDQLADWLNDLKATLTYAEHCATQGHWPMNDKACGAFGGCEFRGICSKDPAVRQQFLESDFHRVPWNPLADR